MAKKTASRTKRRVRPLTLKVKGAGPPGRIAVPELILLCQQAQSAVDRQAESMKGKKTLRPGPTIGQVKLECTLELTSLGHGSATLRFDFAKQQPSLPQVMALGEQAVVGVVEAINQVATGKTTFVDPGVLDSINGLSALFDHRRVSSVEWIAHRSNGHQPKRVTAVYNEKVKSIVAKLVRLPTVARITVEGIVEMADFKPGELKCRVLQPVGAAIPCTFSPDEADSLYDVLRKSARVEGDATINPQTNRIDSLRIVSVTPIHSLFVGKGNFWHGLSLEDLAKAQEVEPVTRPEMLVGGIPEDEDVDALLADIYRQRE